jgi:hypothetical protein
MEDCEMKKTYIKPDIRTLYCDCGGNILQGSIDIPEEPGNQDIIIPGDDEDFDPSMGHSKGDDFDPWGWSFKDDLMW